MKSKKIKSLLLLSFIIISFSACASVQETYSPLYELKPEIKEIKE